MGSAAIGQFRVPPSCRVDRGTGLTSFWPTTLKELFAWQAEASMATASRGTSAGNRRRARIRGPLPPLLFLLGFFSSATSSVIRCWSRGHRQVAQSRASAWGGAAGGRRGLPVLSRGRSPAPLRLLPRLPRLRHCREHHATTASPRAPRLRYLGVHVSAHAPICA